MPRYRTLNNHTEINVDGVRLRAGADGAFDVVAGSRAEEVLIAGGAINQAGGYFAAGPGLRWGLFGHSKSDQEAISGSGVIEGFTAVGAASWAIALMRCPVQIVKEVAAGGYRLLDLLSLYDTLVKPYDLDGIIVRVGHNDLKGLYPSGNATAQALYPQLPADAQQTQLPYLAARLRAWLSTQVEPTQKVVLLAETAPGQNPAGASAGTSVQLAARTLAFNRLLRSLALEYRNVIYVPLDRALLASSSAIGLNKPLTYFDQIHQSILGAYYEGKVIAEHLQRILPVHADPLPYSAADTHTAAVLTSSAAPSAGGGVLTLPLTNGTGTLKLGTNG